jgi:dTDP-L-rhamnose 4-epimerase
LKVLITGGAGFIGSYTARALLARGHDVTVFDNFSEQVHTCDRAASFTWRSIERDVQLVEGDVRDRQLLADVAPEFDSILHLAAETGTGQSMYDIAHYCDVNVGGTANLLEALARRRGRVGRIVVASSRAVYGEGQYRCAVHGAVYPDARSSVDMAAGRFDSACPACGACLEAQATREDSILRPASVYAVTKLSQEQLVLAVGASIGVSATALRYQNVYGPGQSLHNPYTGILSIFSTEMRAGRAIEIFEDGLESRDFVHVEDVARVNVACLEANVAVGVPLNVGTGQATSVREVAETLREAYGSSSSIRVSGRFRVGDIRHNFACVERLRESVKFVPSIQFATGVAGFCSWASDQLHGADLTSSRYSVALRELEERGFMRGRADS